LFALKRLTQELPFIYPAQSNLSIGILSANLFSIFRWFVCFGIALNCQSLANPP